MRRLAAASILLAVAVGQAFPQIVVKAVIEGRQASMRAIAGAARTIAGMFEGKLAYNAKIFKAAAETIRHRSGNAMVAGFPATSLGAPSAARREIDLSREEFTELARHLENLATVLSAQADRSPDSITPDMRMAAGASMGSSLLGKRANSQANANVSNAPAEHIFHLMLQDCTNCHAKFREKRR